MNIYYSNTSTINWDSTEYNSLFKRENPKMPVQQKLPKSGEVTPADGEQVTKIPVFSVRQANLMFTFTKLQGRTFKLCVMEGNVIQLIIQQPVSRQATKGSARWAVLLPRAQGVMSVSCNEGSAKWAWNTSL